MRGQLRRRDARARPSDRIAQYRPRFCRVQRFSHAPQPMMLAASSRSQMRRWREESPSCGPPAPPRPTVWGAQVGHEVRDREIRLVAAAEMIGTVNRRSRGPALLVESQGLRATRRASDDKSPRSRCRDLPIACATPGPAPSPDRVGRAQGRLGYRRRSTRTMSRSRAVERRHNAIRRGSAGRGRFLLVEQPSPGFLS